MNKSRKNQVTPNSSSSPNSIDSFLASTGQVGRSIGKQLASLYKAIDPDVMRHLAHLPLLSYSLFSSNENVIEVQKADGYRPLIFVHGLGGTRGDFAPMMGFFWLNGRRRTYRISFKNNQNIEQMAKALVGFVGQVRKVTREKKVDIIAHSLGGVVSRLAILSYGLSYQVDTLITLGSPHQGTHCARYANTSILKDLRPNSPLMKKLMFKPWPEKVTGISLWSQSDILVLPAESAIANGTKAIEMTPFTHYSYLIHPKSWSTVHSLLVESTLS